MYDIFEKLCKEHNVTPYKISKETKIATSTLSDWKTGKTIPKKDKMIKIADYFGVSLDYLMTGKETDAPEYNSEYAELLEVYSSLNEDMKQKALAILKILN